MQPGSRRHYILRSCAAVLALATAACGDGGAAEAESGQVVAQVNDAELTIHQLNARLQNVQVPTGTDPKAVQKQALEGLINEELAYQAALDQNLDRDPQVMQRLEQARRGLLAQAYLERRGSSTAAPPQDAVRRFYDENPGLFAQRRQYHLAEVAVQGAAADTRALETYFNSEAASLSGLVEQLRQKGSDAAISTATRNAEDLPLGLVPAFLKMKVGDKAFYRAGDTMHFIEVRGIQPAPVSFELARPRIEAFLRAQSQGNAAREQIAALRKDAKIQYKSGFEAPSAKAPAAPAEPAVTKDDDAVARGVKGL